MTGELNEIASSNLEVVLLNRTFVLPWGQFLFAEGGSEEIRLAFSTHDVLVTGSCLDKLLNDLSARRLSRLQEPGRAEMFDSFFHRSTDNRHFSPEGGLAHACGQDGVGPLKNKININPTVSGDDLRKRIEMLKQQSAKTAKPSKQFEYDPDQPLQLPYGK